MHQRLSNNPPSLGFILTILDFFPLSFTFAAITIIDVGLPGQGF